MPQHQGEGPEIVEVIATLERAGARLDDLRRRVNLMNMLAASTILQGAAWSMWSVDIFDEETTKLVDSASFQTYEELRGWLIALIGRRPNAPFWASFRIPADATESQRRVLGTLGPARSALH